MTLFSGRFRIDGYLAEPAGSKAPELEQIGTVDAIAGVDLRPDCSPVENQGTVGSCTANAIVGALEYFQIVCANQCTDLSRLFVYYNARRLSNREGDDCGASMSHAMASILGFGACPEAVWSYDDARWPVKPPEQVYARAVTFPGLHYGRVAPNDMRKALLAAGLPIIFGMGVPQHLMMVVGAQTGYMPAPADGRWEQPSGGHAMLIVGFDENRKAWLVRNSWGSDWGEGGYVWIDYQVMDHYAQPNGYWTVGPLDRNRFFRVKAHHADSFMTERLTQQPQSLPLTLSDRRVRVRGELQSNLEQNRQSIRDRLRGPGAGGGYDKGPGVGGGYDQGPGVGGGYDKGPGAGGGYED